ncbi:O-acetyl-ADP-ribose deacetylase [Planctomicrobium sp. SH664]|uniref:O-acetyl-ADP-ribose deacetylase n=1 Tax=Planctomicrobium sp. SH664 TaxID=3448125 RepID=UPI003F5B081B
MRRMLDDCVVELVIGEITAQTVDAIVNAANAQLIPGGGVDGAIHRAAGPSLLEELRARYPEGCPTGSAVSTSAGLLPARFVFHAVGPIWSGGRQGEPDLLRSAYQRCLQLATELECRSIAFPAISTGAYGYPLDRAAEVALTTIVDFLQEHEQPQLVRLVLFSEGAHGAFARVLQELLDD